MQDAPKTRPASGVAPPELRRLPSASATAQAELVVIADPGPDPDDVKAILAAAVLHRDGTVRLRAVVCNGGTQATERALLARCILDHLHSHDIPVGIGTPGKAYAALAHEYNIAGYDADGARARLHDGHALLMRTLRESAPSSLSIVCISSMRDLADVIAVDPELVVSRVQLVAIQAGLERDAPDGHWRADASVNNGFDAEAAQRVYEFCFERRIPMTVTSRHAVPMLPMQLARSFATRIECPVMSYLADAQFAGLKGLWCKLCEGQLPLRCTKQWYFETFCGVDAGTFVERGFGTLDASANIVQHLNGFVKPYDVVALMTALPITRSLFTRRAEHVVNGTTHLLLLEPSMAISVAHVVKLLRNTYHEVVLATARPARVARRTRGSAQSWNTPDVRGSNASSERRSCGLLTRSRASVAGGGSPEERSLNTEQKRRQDSPAAQIRATLLRSRGQTAWLEQDRTGRDSNQSRYTDTITRATPGSARTSLPSGSLSHGRVMHMSRARVVPDDRTTGAFELSDLEKLLETALVNARRRQAQIALPAVLTGLSLLFLLVTLQISRHALARDAHLRTGRTIGVAALDFALSAATVLVLVLLGLALQPLASFRPLLALAFAIIAVHGVASGALWCVPLVHAVASGGWTSASALALGSVGAHAAVDLATGLLSLSLCAAAAWPPSSGAHARQLLSGFFTLATSWLALGAGLTVLDALVDAAPDNTRAFGGEDVLDGANTLAALLGALALGVRRARSGLRGALGQLARTKGRSAALAPLIGFGSAHETSPAAVIAAAMRTFRPFELTPQSLGASMFAHAADARAPDAVHACEARSTSCVAPPLLAPSRAPSFSRRAGAQTPSAAESRQRDAHMLNPPAAEKRLGSQRHSIVGGARQQRESTPTADKADYFVVHARADDARLRQRALERWSAHKARAGGPVPVVWLQAHADGVRGGASRIESSLVHLARSRRLLLLCGPSFADDVHVLMLLWAWHQLHGSRSSTGVEIVPVIANAGEADALVASIDAFAVVHTAERLAGDEDGRRFVRALQADSVSRFNELVRGYLPRVTEAIGTYAALQLGVRSDDVVAHAHTPAREPLSACVPHAAPAGGCVADA